MELYTLIIKFLKIFPIKDIHCNRLKVVLHSAKIYIKQYNIVLNYFQVYSKGLLLYFHYIFVIKNMHSIIILQNQDITEYISFQIS